MKPRRKVVVGAIGALALAGVTTFIFWVNQATPCRVAYDRVRLGMSEDAVRWCLPAALVETGNAGSIVRGDWEGMFNGEHRIVHIEPWQEPWPSNDPIFKSSLLRTAWKNYETEHTPEGIRYKDKKTGRVLFTQWDWFRCPDGMTIIFDADGHVVEKGYYIRRTLPVWDQPLKWVADLF